MKKILLLIAVFFCLMLTSCVSEKNDDIYMESMETYYEYGEAYEEEVYEETYYEEEVELLVEGEGFDVSDQSLPDPVMINADFEATANPEGSFVIKTNLPDETELLLSLSGRGYLAQSKAKVKDGVAVSERFTNNGDQLIGDFTLEILMPIPEVQTDYVKHFIGNNGEYLTGPYVKGTLGSDIVEKEVKVSFALNTGNSEKTVSDAVVENDYESGYNYYRTPTGKKYHLDPNCGGKNCYIATNISDLSPCSKCAE